MCFYRNLKAFESLKAIKPMVPRWMSPFRSPFREETGGYSHMQVVSCWEHVKRPLVPILSAFLLLGYPILRLKSCQISNVSCYVMLKNPKSSASPALPQPFPSPSPGPSPALSPGGQGAHERQLLRAALGILGAPSASPSTAPETGSGRPERDRPHNIVGRRVVGMLLPSDLLIFWDLFGGFNRDLMGIQ